MGVVWILCGPLASGKSTVASFFAEAGAMVMDADRVVGELYEENATVREQLHEAFGEEVFDELGEVNREAISGKVFADAKARAKLEEILHPQVIRHLAEEAATFREKPGGLLLLEVVLWMRLDPAPFPVDGICMTLAPEDRLVRRAVQRGGLDEAEARARLSAQGDWRRWADRADVIIDTDCPREALRDTVLSYYRAWIEKEEGPTA